MYSVGSLLFGLLSTGWLVWWYFAPKVEMDVLGFVIAIGGWFIFSAVGVVLGAAGLYLQEARRWATVALVLSLWPWALLLLAGLLIALR